MGLQVPPLNDLKCPWRSPPALLCPGVTAGTTTSVRRRNRSTPSVLRKGFESHHLHRVLPGRSQTDAASSARKATMAR